MKPIRILVADDHKIFRQGVLSILSQHKDLLVSGEAAGGEEIYRVLDEKETDLILLDIELGKESGVQIARSLRERYPSVRILVLSMHQEERYIVDMLENGASGYLLKDSGMEELLAAIRAVASGKTYLDREVSEILVKYLNVPLSGRSREEPEIKKLTHREKQVLELIVREYSNAEIAERLFISMRTVDAHRRNMLSKLGLKNTAGLVKYAIQHKLLDQETL